LYNEIVDLGIKMRGEVSGDKMAVLKSEVIL